MEKLIYFIIHLVFPIVILIIIFKKKHKSKVGFVLTFSLGLFILWFLFIWGQWPLVGSYNLRFIIISFMILILIRGFYIYPRLEEKIKLTYINWFQNIITATLFVFLLYKIGNAYINNNKYLSPPVALEFPLKGKNYYISSGGANALFNNHMRTAPSAQQYAIDINKIDKSGAVKKDFMSSKNTDHYIFGDTVYAPCDAIVLDIENTIKDNLTSSMDVSKNSGTGNFVSLKHNDVFIFIPHLKQGSILVNKGDRIEVGTPLGVVGNSGFSQEPHLHFQAAKYNVDSVLVGIPVSFNNKILVRNNIYINKIIIPNYFFTFK